MKTARLVYDIAGDAFLVLALILIHFRIWLAAGFCIAVSASYLYKLSRSS